MAPYHRCDSNLSSPFPSTNDPQPFRTVVGNFVGWVVRGPFEKIVEAMGPFPLKNWTQANTTIFCT